MVVFTAAAMGLSACAAPGDEDTATASQALCGDPYVTNVSVRPGSVYNMSPDSLLNAAEAWGPQTLLLSVDRRLGSTFTMLRQPSVQIAKDQITKGIQETTGINLIHDIELTASSSTEVPPGSYERLEAYPEYQVITWDLRQSGCGFARDTYLTSGAVYRPMGVYFRIVVMQGHPDHEGKHPQYGSITAIGVPVVGEEATHPDH